MRHYNSLLVPVALLLTACATAPKPLQGDYAEVAPRSAAPQGQRVRWGGEIIHVDPTADRTCFEILGRELDAIARPRRSDDSAGRFIACRDGYDDPEVFTKGREITVTGVVRGTLQRKVGDYEYTYPEVDADVVYLWQKPSMRVHYEPYPWGWDPFWYGWHRPPIVIVRHHGPSKPRSDD
jgi:outer membrane lipoprotein